MAKINIHIISQNSSFNLELNCEDSEHDAVMMRVLYPFIDNFNEADKIITIIEYQQHTLELRNRIKSVVEELKSCNPEIYKLYSYFTRNVKENNWFFITDKIVETEQLKKIQYQLLIHNNPQEKDLITKANDLREKLENFYEIKVYDQNTLEYIGEKDKSKRICRYCKKSMPEVSFKKVAHTISEAFGNKTIITNDECDACNQMFGDTIESDLLSIFDFPRIYFHVKGKKGEPKKLEGSNYTFYNDLYSKECKLHIKKIEAGLADTGTRLVQILEPSRKVPSINIYKCLVKYAFGVLDESELLYLDKTLQWLNGHIRERNLPPIVWKIYDLKFDHPQMCVFIKQHTDTPSLPHILVSIRLINTCFVYIIPFSEKDNFDFSEYDNFTQVLEWFELFTEPGYQITYCDENQPIIKIKYKK